MKVTNTGTTLTIEPANEKEAHIIVNALRLYAEDEMAFAERMRAVNCPAHAERSEENAATAQDMLEVLPDMPR